MNPRIWGVSKDGLVKYLSLPPSKVEETLNLLRNKFFAEERLCKLCGISKHPAAVAELSEATLSLMKDGVSIIAEENSKGKVVGFTINILNRKNSFTKGFNLKHPSAQIYRQLTAELDEKVDIFTYLQAGCFMEAMYTYITPEFRKQGMVEDMSLITIEIAQRLRNGEDVRVPIDSHSDLVAETIPYGITTAPSSPAIIRICDKLGLEHIAKVDLNEVQALKGLLSTKLDPVTVMCKKLKKL